jgi:hypothetical protein
VQRDDYGWALPYPQRLMTTTSQSGYNQPTNPLHAANLSKLSDFLGKLPFPVGINSGFRTPSVNTAVGGSSSSQHMNGLGADLLPPPGTSNKDLAVYFWHYRDKMPELDQVIWYMYKGHTHIGICPKDGTGCMTGASPGHGRQEFRKDMGGSAPSWTPSLADQSTLGARGLIALGPPRDWKKVALITAGVTGGFLLLVAGAYLYMSRD